MPRSFLDVVVARYFPGVGNHSHLFDVLPFGADPFVQQVVREDPIPCEVFPVRLQGIQGFTQGFREGPDSFELLIGEVVEVRLKGPAEYRCEKYF